MLLPAIGVLLLQANGRCGLSIYKEGGPLYSLYYRSPNIRLQSNKISTVFCILLKSTAMPSLKKKKKKKKKSAFRLSSSGESTATVLYQRSETSYDTY